jgi:glycosyltransferase involved in cell wall biosynthesis
MNLGVIITTYNNPAWLEKVLWGYQCQTDHDFQVILADDGSGEETRSLIEKFKQENSLNILHVWHEDQGFRKTKILNDSIRATDCDYLLLTDHDCLPRNDLIQTHKALAKPGHFLSAGYYKLTMPVSKAITRDDIQSTRAFDYRWLVSQGQPKSLKSFKLTARDWQANWLNKLTPTKPTWNGANSSTWKKDIVAVNGFNEQMQYGGLDREMGERMMNNGMKGIQIRYSAVCLHLDHKRSYDTPETWATNRAIRDRVRQENITWTEMGIDKPG